MRKSASPGTFESQDAMVEKYREIAFTPSVLEAQRLAYGTAQGTPTAGENDELGPLEIEFIQSRDSFYLATVSETGWPYVQHRGGPIGFLHALDSRTLAFADLRGNRQLLSTGNLSKNDRVALFLMDYPSRRRLKIQGTVTLIDARQDPDLARSLVPASLSGRVERIFAIRVIGFDWNCPSYITPRFTESEVMEVVAPLKQRIAELEARLRAGSVDSDSV